MMTLRQCERCETVLEAGDIRCAICGQAVPDRTTTTEQEHVDVQILRCTGCGAAAAFDPEHQGLSCIFCDSVVKSEIVHDPMEQSKHFLPFTVDPDDARAALRRWLGSLGWFRPGDLTSSARLEHLRPLWWVGWVFDAEALVSWSGDSNEGAWRSAWAPHSGQTNMTFDDLLIPASRGLTEDEANVVGPCCDLMTAHKTPEGAEGATIEQFDVHRSLARRQIVSAIERFAAHRVTQHHIPGTRHRKVKAAVLLRDLATRRLSFPAWVLAYRYKSRLYRVVVCGQDASCVTGSAPRSIAKILAVVLGCILGLGILLAMIVAATSM